MSPEVKIPIYRLGHQDPYTSQERRPLIGYDGANLGEYSMTHGARIELDGRERLVEPLLEMIRGMGMKSFLGGMVKASKIFRNDTLESGGKDLNPEQYVELQSRLTGVPHKLCYENMDKIANALLHVEATLRGHLYTWRGRDISLEDLWMGKEIEGVRRQAILLGGIYPSNSAGVYQLTPPGLAFGPYLIKPGSGEVLSPERMRAALKKAGFPVKIMGIYPGDGEDLANPIRAVTNRQLIFGGEETVRKYHGNPRYEVHGPGCSKIIIGPDKVDSWREHLPIMVQSAMNGSGRGCISLSAIYAPKKIAEEVANALADEIGSVTYKPLDDPDARLSVFGNAGRAQSILDSITEFVAYGGGKFVTPENDRAVNCGAFSCLRPVVAHIPSVPKPGELSPSRFEFPAPAVLVVGYGEKDRLERVIGSTLVCTVISDNQDLLQRLAEEAEVSRLNRDPIATTTLHVAGKRRIPLEGRGMPAFLHDATAGKPKDKY